MGAYSLPAKAGPWGQQAGDILLITSLSHYQGENGTGFRQIASQTYGELGLGHRFTLIGNFIYTDQYSDQREDPFAARGWAERSLAIQRQIRPNHPDRWAIKLGFIANANLQRYGPAGFSNQQARDEAIDFGLLWGRNFGDEKKHFIAIENSLRKSLGADADQLKVDIAIGYTLTPRLTFNAKSYNSFAVSNPAPIAPLKFGNDYDSFQLQISAQYKLTTRYHFELALLDEYAGRNIAEGRAISLSLWSRY